MNPNFDFRDRLVIALGNFMHEDNELFDFLGLCLVMFVIAMGVGL